MGDYKGFILDEFSQSALTTYSPVPWVLTHFQCGNISHQTHSIYIRFIYFNLYFFIYIYFYLFYINLYLFQFIFILFQFIVRFKINLTVLCTSEWSLSFLYFTGKSSLSAFPLVENNFCHPFILLVNNLYQSIILVTNNLCCYILSSLKCQTKVLVLRCSVDIQYQRIKVVFLLLFLPQF